MQNNFETTAINEAKHILEKDLQIATHIHAIQKNRQKEWEKSPSIWKQIKTLFRKYF